MNLSLALAFQSHVHHVAAREWFDANHFSDVERLALVGEKSWQEGMATF